MTAVSRAVDLWTMRSAHRPACRGQRWRVAHRAGLRPQLHSHAPPSRRTWKSI